MKAPISGRMAAGWKTPMPGRMMIIAPISAAMMPRMRRQPIYSPKNSPAPKVISTGLMSMIAVASAMPIYCSEVKNSEAEASCVSARRNCRPGWRDRRLGKKLARK